MSSVLLIMAWFGTILVFLGIAESKRLGYVYFALGFVLHVWRSALMRDVSLCVLFVLLVAFMITSYVRASRQNKLRSACEDLLASVQIQHPREFFLIGDAAYTCPHHKAIAEALRS